MTAERRDELAALLDNDQRLRVEYPKVAEYLDMAPQLTGTGNAGLDAEFDLRLVHYLTGGQSVTENPYWEIVESSVFEFKGRRVVNGGHVNGSSRLGFAEFLLQATYSYAIPSPETLEWVAAFCGTRPIVELGAGRGYWAAQLTHVGLRVDAYDSDPPDTVANLSFPQSAGQKDVWYPVKGLHDFTETVSRQSNSVLFLCWPPGWGNTMASQALIDFEKTGGTRLIFMGEPQGGKTGDDVFFDILSTGWRLESQDERYVSWWNLNDIAQGWVRR